LAVVVRVRLQVLAPTIIQLVLIQFSLLLHQQVVDEQVINNQVVLVLLAEMVVLVVVHHQLSQVDLLQVVQVTLQSFHHHKEITAEHQEISHLVEVVEVDQVELEVTQLLDQVDRLGLAHQTALLAHL
jgi:hypothetical protein